MRYMEIQPDGRLVRSPYRLRLSDRIRPENARRQLGRVRATGIETGTRRRALERRAFGWHKSERRLPPRHDIRQRADKPAPKGERRLVSANKLPLTESPPNTSPDPLANTE